MAQIIDGKARAKELRKSLKERVASFAEQNGRAPGLGVILVVVSMIPSKRYTEDT